MVRLRTLLAGGAVILATTGSAQAFTIQFVNRSATPDAQVYVTLTGGASADGVLTDDGPIPLTSIPGRTVSFNQIAGARIYFGFGQGAQLASSPVTTPFRFDKFEFTLPGDVNLTAVDFFGIPLRIQVLGPSGSVSATRTFSCDADTVKAALLRIPGARRALRTSRGTFLRVLSPSIRPSAYPSLVPYINSLAGRTLTVKGTFEGSPVTGYDYAGRITKGGSVTLNGTTTVEGAAPTPGPPIVIPGGGALSTGIYSANGSYTVGGQASDVSQNDVYSAVYRDFVTGFAFGYWGGRFGDTSSAWRGKPQFRAARRSVTRYAAFSEYASVINAASNAYGYPFSDVGPTPILAPISLSDTGLRVTILPDATTGRQAGCRLPAPRRR